MLDIEFNEYWDVKEKRLRLTLDILNPNKILYKELFLQVLNSKAISLEEDYSLNNIKKTLINNIIRVGEFTEENIKIKLYFKKLEKEIESSHIIILLSYKNSKDELIRKKVKKNIFFKVEEPSFQSFGVFNLENIGDREEKNKDEITYKITLENNGDYEISNLTLESLIAEGTVYLKNSLIVNGENLNFEKLKFMKILRLKKGYPINIFYKVKIKEEFFNKVIKNKIKANFEVKELNKTLTIESNEDNYLFQKEKIIVNEKKDLIIFPSIDRFYVDKENFVRYSLVILNNSDKDIFFRFSVESSEKLYKVRGYIIEGEKINENLLNKKLKAAEGVTIESYFLFRGLEITNSYCEGLIEYFYKGEENLNLLKVIKSERLYINRRI